MKRIFLLSPVLLTAVLLLAAFIPVNSGKKTWKMEVLSANFSEAGSKKMESVYRDRLEHFGIDKKDLKISSEANFITIEISGWDNYSAKGAGKISRLLESPGHLAFWESYTTSEIGKSLKAAFQPGENSALSESSPEWEKFRRLFIVENSNSVEAGNTCLFGWVRPGDTARVQDVLDSILALKKLPEDLRFAWTVKGMDDATPSSGLVLLKAAENGKARMDAPALYDVKVVASKYNPAPVISFRMAGNDSLEWGKMTKANTQRQIPIAIDNRVFSYPTVQGEITGGVSSITGNFSKEEAELLCNALRSPLPFPVRKVEESEEK